ncbi:MAG: DUF6152 family protein [Gammaproteobacteria bacterium]
MTRSLHWTGARLPWLLLLLSPLVQAHHGSLANNALYENDELLEFEGEIIEVLWRNPHARARLRVVDENGAETVYEIETQPGPIEFGRMGIAEEDLYGNVRIAGYRSKRNPNSIGAMHLLLPSGQEYVPNNREPLWSDEGVRIVLQEPDPVREAQERETANGIFRMWSRRLGPRPSPDGYSDLLTERGRELAAEYDPPRDNPELDCRSGIATTMFDPNPMEVVDGGDHITLILEEYDIRRTIHLNADVEPERSPLGFSVGRWEDDNTLIVTTTHLDYPYLDPYGTPQSDQVEYSERFELSEDDTMMSYSLTATDAIMYTAPITLETTRRWAPGIEIPPFNCVGDDWQG